jgi:sugar lactone lactonase YvrE
MGARELGTLLDGGHYFEGPRWHGGRWWVSDFYGYAVLAVGTDGGVEEMLTVPGQPSGLGWLPDGSLLAVSMRDHRLLRQAPDGAVTVHAELGEHCGGLLNDLIVDAHGRAYVGNFGFDLMGFADPETAPLLRVDLDGGVSVAAADLMFPNGTVITPDGGRLIVSETLASRFTVFDIEPDGALSGRRTWQVAPAPPLGPLAEMLPGAEFAPDGLTLDADGHLWSADALGGRCCRVAPGGTIVEEIAAPDGLGFFACMLGGDDGRTLLLCAAPDFAEEARKGAREAILFTTTVDVPHAGRP